MDYGDEKEDDDSENDDYDRDDDDNDDDDDDEDDDVALRDEVWICGIKHEADVHIWGQLHRCPLWYVPTADQINSINPDQAILAWSGSLGKRVRGQSTLIGIALASFTIIFDCQKYSCRKPEHQQFG